MKLRKKLIEVALPLEAINKASAREKSIRHGHPSTLHLWWARRPLAATRAVIFSQMVDDPSEYVDTLKSDPKLLKRAESELKKRYKVWEEATTELARAEAAGISAPPPGPEPTLDEVIAEQERDRLFKIIEDLVLWENTTNETVLEAASAEIWQSWRRTCADNADHPRAKELFDRNKLPAFHDPFAGGGALPLEAQRLGLEAYASDLNPVAVLINKAMIEIPPKFASMPPVNPEWQSKSDAEKAIRTWKGAEGLADDVRYYGKWMRDEAEKRIGHLYPKVEVTEEMAKDRPDLKQYLGKKLTVIAWIWARTVKSPNPAFRDVDVPLVSSFILSKKAGKEAFVSPIISGTEYRFDVRSGNGQAYLVAEAGTSAGLRSGFRCLLSDAPIPFDYIRTEGTGGRLGQRLMAIVGEGKKGRAYLPPTQEAEQSAFVTKPEWKPETRLEGKCRVNVSLYGFNEFGDLFTDRQLTALGTFSELIGECYGKVVSDINQLRKGGELPSAEEYAKAVSLYMAFALDKGANYWSSACTWHQTRDGIVSTFGRQAIPMIWDYAEANPLSNSSGNFLLGVDQAARMLEAMGLGLPGVAAQSDAGTQDISESKVISTDPPYYDNISYADLSDFFYVWLRHSLRTYFPELFSTLAVPKEAELVATPYRHGTKDVAEKFFLDGMTQAMRRLSKNGHGSFPVTIYYAFKQAESNIVTRNKERQKPVITGNVKPLCDSAVPAFLPNDAVPFRIRHPYC